MWLVEILSISGDVAAVLARNGYSLLEVEESSASHLLSHPRYIEYSDSNDVWKDVKSVKRLLRRFSEIEGAVDLGFDLGSIRKTKPDGTFNRHHFLEVNDSISMSVSVSANLTVGRNLNISIAERDRLIREAKIEEDASLRDAMIRRASLVLSQPRALQVMELLKKSNFSGTDLGHIVDLVRDSCDGDLTRYATKAEANRFYRSINHPTVLGMQARHAVSREVAPPKPMAIGEATAFARRVASTWLNELESDG